MNDNEILLKIKQSDKELWSGLKELAELYQENPERAQIVVNRIVQIVKANPSENHKDC